MSRHWLARGLAGFVACCTAVISCPTGESMTPGASSPQIKHKNASTAELGGPNRYLTMVSTDKPIYRIGESVYIRGVMLNATTHHPLEGTPWVSTTIEIRGPKGDVVSRSYSNVQDSIWGAAWTIPEGTAGGEYTIAASYPNNGYTPAQRKFEVRAYRAPRLKSQITFLRDGYGPGEKVTATLDVKRAEGGIPEGAKVSVTGVVDGIEIKGAPGKVDAKGLCTVSLDLPHDIPRGEGTLALIVEDGGVVETASKTIPILLQTVDVSIYPEGGDLVAGFPNRVYVQTKQPNGKPADVTAKVLTKNGGQVAEFHSEHEGRGRFQFTPVAGRSYYLAISQPAGIKKHFALPAVKPTGAVIRSDKDVFGRGEPISFHVGCSKKNFHVTLAKRESEFGTVQVSTPGGDRSLHEIVFKLGPHADGVLTATVWDNDGNPLAERLVFRQPENPLKISVHAEKSKYIPGENAKLTVKTTDADGKPVSAIVGVSVADDSVLEMVEKREQAPRLPVMFYLEPEVKDLADAHVYLDPTNHKAPLATDLLLGTQGWRRLALMDLPKFVEKYGDDARRALAIQLPQFYGNEMVGGGDGPDLDVVAALPRAKFFAAPRGVQVLNAAPVVHGMQQRAAHFAPGFMAPPVPPPMAEPVAKKDMMAVAPSVPRPSSAAGAPGGAPSPVPMPKPQPINRKGFNLQVEEGAFAGGGADAQREMGKAMHANLMVARRQRIMDDKEVSRSSNGMIVVREFAHAVRPNRKPTDRQDFAETLYWNAGVKTDAKTGEAKVAFGLNDSVTTFRVLADGFAQDGSLGSANVGVESVQPFYAEAKMPLEVTAGDRILLPVSFVNATGEKLSGASSNVDLKGDFKLGELVHGPGAIAAGERVRAILPINVGMKNGNGGDFVLSAKAGAYEDNVTRKFSVKPQGFPIEVAFGGVIEPGKSVIHTISIPKAIAPRSLVSNTAVFPTPLANMTEALQRLIQDPNGCFEQTSSTSYPLTMAQQYFLSHTGIDPKLVETSKQKLDAGYKRLVGFWCPDRGYEWFGENPGHEALTAFGLLHFADMSKVREVDQNMVASTRSWLLKQKDGNGGFTRKRRSLHTWIEDKDCSNAYIVWALLESGTSPSELKQEIAALEKTAATSQNSYVVALAANALWLAGDKAQAKTLMDRLAAKQKPDGSVDGMKASIVGSEGESLQIEGTSLATLAWLRDPAYAGRVERSIKFLADSCKGGRYGSTQSTVLALRAIVAYDAQRAHPKAAGKVRVYVDGQSIGDWADFTPSTQGAIKLPDLTELLTPGDHKLELRMEGGSPMPYSMAVKYNSVTPASDKDCKVDVAVKLAHDKVVEGTADEADVTVINKSKDAIPTPIAIVGLPGGLEPRHDQLKELVKKGKIDAYEVIGREVVLYWRALPGQAKVEVPISVIAAVPGSYTGPASRAYLYYTDEHKRWVDGVHVEIAPK